MSEQIEEYNKRLSYLEESLRKTQDILLGILNIMLTQEFDVKYGLELDVIMMMQKERKNETT